MNRINHLAVWAAAIAYFLFGWLWYGVVFSAPWTALMGRTAAEQQTPPTVYLWSFVLGLVLSCCERRH